MLYVQIGLGRTGSYVFNKLAGEADVTGPWTPLSSPV